jgi:hypothetical protein
MAVTIRAGFGVVIVAVATLIGAGDSERQK